MKYTIPFGFRRRAKSSAAVEMKAPREDGFPTGLFVPGDTGSRFPNMPRRDTHPVRKIMETTNVPVVKRDPKSAPCSPNGGRPFVASLSAVFGDYHTVPSYYLNHHLLQREQISDNVGSDTRGRSHTMSGPLTGILASLSSPIQEQDPFNASFQSYSEGLGAEQRLNQIENLKVANKLHEMRGLHYAHLVNQYSSRPSRPPDTWGKRPGPSSHYGSSNENIMSLQRPQQLPTALSNYSDKVIGTKSATLATRNETTCFDKGRYCSENIDSAHRRQHPVMPTVDLSESSTRQPKDSWDDRHLDGDSLRRCRSFRRVPIESRVPQSSFKTPPLARQHDLQGMSPVSPLASRYQRRVNRPNAMATEAESPLRPSHRRRQQVPHSPNRSATVIDRLQSPTTSPDAHAQKRRGVDLTDAVMSALMGIAPGEEDSDETDNMADDEAIARPIRKESVCQHQARRSSGCRSGRPSGDQEFTQREGQLSKTSPRSDRGRIPACSWV